MFKHKINYKDFNGNERAEDFYFHLSLPEVTRLEASIGGSISDHIKTLVADEDLNALLSFFERIILDAYGKKTTDGRSFYKSKELKQEFEYSQAYAELFEEIIKNPDLAEKFGKAVADNGKSDKQPMEAPVK